MRSERARGAILSTRSRRARHPRRRSPSASQRLRHLGVARRFIRFTSRCIEEVAKLTSEWFFPKEIWNQSDQILKGFESEDEEPPPNGERPRLIHEMSGWRFYAHRTQYQGQQWVCPLLKAEPCAQCEWYVPGDDGRSWCAAVAKIRTLHNDYFRDKDLYDLRDELVRKYGDRRRRTGAPSENGYYADPSRPIGSIDCSFWSNIGSCPPSLRLYRHYERRAA